MEKKSASLESLSRREREIMDALFQRGKATAAEVQEALPDAAGYSSIRKLLTILEGKGFVRHENVGKQYVYIPTEDPDLAAKGAFQRVLSVFFRGSLEGALTTMLNQSEQQVSDEELARIEKLIREARKEREA